MKRRSGFSWYGMAGVGAALLFFFGAGGGLPSVGAADDEVLENSVESADPVYAELEKRAAQNDPDAWFELGKLYFEGFGCEQPPCEWALRCFRKSEELRPNAEVKMFIELCGRRLAAEKAAEESTGSTVSPMEKALAAHFQEMRRRFGSGNVDAVLEQLIAASPEMDGEAFALRLVKLPGTIRLAGWNFDPAGCRRYIRENTIDDREGFSRWMTEDFREMPLSENLLAVNPSIRVINHTLEEFAARALNQTYLPCGESELAGFRKLILGTDESTDQVDFAGWKISDDVFFTIMTDNSGAWRLRSYRFLLREKGRFYWFGEYDCMPDERTAAAVAGFLLREPNSLNNIAVLLSESGCDADAVVENLLKEADEKGCVAASYNLGLFCLTHKRKAEAQKWLQKALKQESELRNSLLLE